MPGIGPRADSELVIGIDIGEFASHDRLVSYYGLASRNRQSGTSISSVTASRQGNKRLNSLHIFLCNFPVGSDNRFGEFYRKCRDRGMPHGMALKAVARKRSKGDIRNHVGQGALRGLVRRWRNGLSVSPPSDWGQAKAALSAT